MVKARSSARRRRPPPRGTTLRLTLSEDATVSVAVERPLPGRRSGRRCVAPTRRLRRNRRCTRYRRVGTVSYRGRKGANRFAFGGRIRGKALAPRAYRLSTTARDAAGNRSSARTLRITILRG